MLYLESKIDLTSLRHWVHSWDTAGFARYLDAKFPVAVGKNNSFAATLVGSFQELVDRCDDAQEYLSRTRGMLSPVMYDYFFRSGNNSMAVANLHELVLVPTDIVTKKHLIKGFKYPEMGAIAIELNGEIIGEIGTKSDLFWHTFYDKYIFEDDESGSIEHMRDNHENEFTLQVWKPGLIKTVAEFEEFADAIIFESARQLDLNFRRERFARAKDTEGEANSYTLRLAGATRERATLAYYASTLSSAIPAHQYLGWYHVLEFYYPRAARILQSGNLKMRITERQMLACVLDRLICWPDFSTWAHQTQARISALTAVGQAPFLGIDFSSSASAVETTAERVYGVRCAIVHSKEGVGTAPIAAGISDALIEPEIPLLKFLAEQAIMHSQQLPP